MAPNTTAVEKLLIEALDFYSELQIDPSTRIGSAQFRSLYQEICRVGGEYLTAHSVLQSDCDTPRFMTLVEAIVSASPTEDGADRAVAYQIKTAMEIRRVFAKDRWFFLQLLIEVETLTGLKQEAAIRVTEKLLQLEQEGKS